MDRVIITRPIVGICYMQVCAVPDATDEEILTACNTQNPSGTERGWTTVIRGEGRQQPVPCVDHPDRLHLLVNC